LNDLLFMNHILKPIHVKSLSGNVFKLLDDEWMLITAGTKAKFNSMTASWGTFGILWNKPVAIGFVRPQRYTYEFINKADYFTLSFYPQQYRDALNIFGTYSGRDIDKVDKSELHPIYTEKGNVYYEEAWLVFECRKLYSDDIKPESFIEHKLIGNIYPQKDFHRFFIGEIINCFASDHFLESKNPEKDPSDGENSVDF
jgi:flavin reductase (DIM6/NTAB) family NADH-FMN oxidoreductase RutF